MNLVEHDSEVVCDCGNDTYHIKFNTHPTEIWAECEDCGRPTSVVGDGAEKQLEWRDAADR